jgi:transcriptional regulator with XRE-family HTH domain
MAESAWSVNYIITGDPMTPPTKHTPSRVTIARMRRELRTWQVADAAGLSRRRMWDIERGRTAATDHEINAIADVLRFPTQFFYRPHLELPTWISR